MCMRIKEQLRLNKAAINTIMARLEDQGATCDFFETELGKKCRQRGDLERQIEPKIAGGIKARRVQSTPSARRLRSSPLTQELQLIILLEEDQRNSDRHI